MTLQPKEPRDRRLHINLSAPEEKRINMLSDHLGRARGDIIGELVNEAFAKFKKQLPEIFVDD